MKLKIFALSLALLLLLVSAGWTQSDNCTVCHQSWEDEDGPSHTIVRDIHIQKGLGCVDCHGGDVSLEDMDEVRAVRGYRGVPDRLKIPEFCARCHSDVTYMHEHNPSLPVDQLEKYKTSVHGQQLFGKKDRKVATCVSCHSVHEIGDAKTPHSTIYPLNLPYTCATCHGNAEYMAGYNVDTNVFDDYAASVHGQALLEKKDLGAPACNDCHGNHGAAPPGVASLTAVCGMCHALESELFDASPHKVAFVENDYPMCETCHSNHLIKKPFDGMIGSVEPAVCIQCHEPDDGTKGIATAEGVHTALLSLVTAHDQARQVLDEAEAKGMMTTDEEFRIKEVEQSLIRARTAVHAFDVDSVMPKVEEGLKKAEEIKTNAAGLIDEYYFRRKGLAFATLFITVLVVALYMRIRRMERK